MEAQKIIRIIDGKAYEIELTDDECRRIFNRFEDHNQCEEITDLIDRLYEGYELCGEPDVDEKNLELLAFLSATPSALREINRHYLRLYYNREDGDWEYDCIRQAVDRYIHDHSSKGDD